MKRFISGAFLVGFYFFLSLLPLAGLWFESRQRQAFHLEQKKEQWLQQAEKKSNEIKVSYKFSFQVLQRLQEIKNRYLRLTDPNATLDGRQFLTLVRRRLPPSHFPEDSIVYLFSQVQTGTISIIRGPGLADRSSRILADVFSKVTSGEVFSKERLKDLNKRCQGLFGDDITFRLLGASLMGKITPVRFSSREYLLTWDVIKSSKRLLGLYVILLPFETYRRSHPLSFALNEIANTSHVGTPLLLPLTGEVVNQRIVVPHSQTLDRLQRQAIFTMVHAKARNASFPLNLLLETFPGLWVYRSAIAAECPYEFCFISRVPSPGIGPTEALLVLSLFFIGTGWLVTFGRRLTDGRAPSISMHIWVVSFFAFLGFISLSSLYFYGTYYIDTAMVRQKNQEIETYKGKIRDVDRGVATVLQRFGVEGQKYFHRTEWQRVIMGPNQASRSALAYQTIQEFSDSELKLSLSGILVYLFGQHLERHLFTTPGESRGIHEALKNLYTPFAQGGGAKLDPGIASLTMANSETLSQELMFSNLLRFGLDGGAFLVFRNLRGKPDYLESAGGTSLIVYDFIADAGKILGVVILLANPQLPYKNYLATRLQREILANPTLDFAMGTMDEGNFIREFPRLGSLWNTRRGKRLHQTLNLTALTRTEQYIEEDGQAYFGFPCLSARGFIIGGSFPIQKFIDTAARQKELLGAICLFLLFLLLFLGTLTAKHLLVPLSLVEQGLRRVADGDLNVRLALKRDDELGDLTGTFDRMIEGIRQRRDLGRFVPADFDARVSAQEGQSSTAAPEKRNGCVLISDIRQFTTLTESYPPRDIVAMLNVHHQTMSSLVEKHGGFVRQFIGDAIIATFFDESARDSCRRAVVAAHDMMREHHAIVDRRRETGQFVYEIGVGIDWGELITGTIGSSGQLGHALLGSPRGTSEKLEGASKQGSHTRIMVSPAVKDACSHHVWAATPVADCWELEREATPL